MILQCISVGKLGACFPAFLFQQCLGEIAWNTSSYNYRISCKNFLYCLISCARGISTRGLDVMLFGQSAQRSSLRGGGFATTKQSSVTDQIKVNRALLFLPYNFLHHTMRKVLSQSSRPKFNLEPFNRLSGHDFNHSISSLSTTLVLKTKIIFVFADYLQSFLNLSMHHRCKRF